MTQTKTKISLAVLFITFALMALVHIDKANAQSTGVTSIEPNVEYNQYDVTGDGRADYLYVSAVHDDYNYTVKTSININGKRCYSKKTSGWLKDLDIVTLKNKKLSSICTLQTKMKERQYGSYFSSGATS